MKSTLVVAATLAAVVAGAPAHAHAGGHTGLGAELGRQVQALLAGAETIGYGNLSGRGRQEQEQTAVRLERRLPTLFRTIADRQAPIEVLTSGVTRATASANAFTAGLTSGDPELAPLIQAPVTNKDLLYFHKQPQNADYQAYKKTAFRAGCRPIAPRSHFYDLTELERCYADALG